MADPVSLTDDGGEERRGNRAMLLVLVGAIVLLVGAGLGIKLLMGKPAAPKRQVARISVVPDQPPPPPPPPKVDKPPEPKDAPKPQPREETPRPAEAPKPADAPLKMEGPAGNGPSPFAGGAVANDYKGGPVGSGNGASAPVGGGSSTPADRAQERYYAAGARQQLRDELDRRLQGEAVALVADFSLWVARDGAIQRVELKPSGDERADVDLRAALDEAQRTLRLAPPPGALTQPLRFRLTLRAAS